MQLDVMADAGEWHTDAARAVLEGLFPSVVSRTLQGKFVGDRRTSVRISASEWISSVDSMSLPSVPSGRFNQKYTRHAVVTPSGPEREIRDTT